MLQGLLQLPLFLQIYRKLHVIPKQTAFRVVGRICNLVQIVVVLVDLLLVS